jgi:hypothetical protein
MDGEEPVRVLNEIKLYEYSLVAFPSNELAKVTGVKSAGQEVADLSTLLIRLPRMLREAKTMPTVKESDVDALLDAIDIAYKMLGDAEIDLGRFEIQRYVFSDRTKSEVESWVRNNDPGAEIYPYGDLWVAGMDTADAFASLKTIEVDEGILAVGGVRTYHVDDADEGDVSKSVSSLTDSLRKFRGEDTRNEPSCETEAEPELDSVESLLAQIRGLAQTLKE